MGRDVIGLGLESSCDETSAAVVRNGSEILSNEVYSQIPLHSEYFGVVPEIASRSHLEVINGLIDKALSDAGVDFRDLSYVSAVNRPGLVGSLLIGLQSAKAISYSQNIPLIAVNHLEAHLYAPFLEGRSLAFPYIGLLVSGGNSALYRVEGIGSMDVLGRTKDDAVGEAFDKVAKFLKLGYPGGPVIEALAGKAVKRDVRLPKILADSKDYNFSYSGIKTAVVNFCRENPDFDSSELAYAFQERALEVLARKLFAASTSENIKKIVVAGGVAANRRLRQILDEQGAGYDIIIPSPALCTDNAAMSTGLAFHYYKLGRFDSLESDVFARA